MSQNMSYIFITFQLVMQSRDNDVKLGRVAKGRGHRHGGCVWRHDKVKHEENTLINVLKIQLRCWDKGGPFSCGSLLRDVCREQVAAHTTGVIFGDKQSDFGLMCSRARQQQGCARRCRRGSSESWQRSRQGQSLRPVQWPPAASGCQKAGEELVHPLRKTWPLSLSHSPHYTQIKPWPQQVSGPSPTGFCAGVAAVCHRESCSLFELVGN